MHPIPQYRHAHAHTHKEWDRANEQSQLEKAPATFVHGQGQRRVEQPLWESVWQFLKKLSSESPCDPAIPLLGSPGEN